MLKYEFWLKLWMGFGFRLGLGHRLGVKERGCARIRDNVWGGVRVLRYSWGVKLGGGGLCYD